MPEIRYTLSFRQRWLHLLLAALFGVLSALRASTHGIAEDFPLFVAPLFLLNFFLFSRFETRLTPQGITCRRYRTLRLDWSEITNVRERRLLGSRSLQLVLADGKVYNLAVPLDAMLQRDREFDTKLATLWNAWTGATGRGAYIPGPDAPEQWQTPPA
ncbi:hypothetical protein [Embleya sp. NPDC059259]|uniref:hypothetical protein n=1 Tax=unclassified Embleya TaxID=2699296 RepID=UPI0036A0461B